MFSALTFLKSKLRNKLDKNVDTWLRLYVTKYEVDNFPYDRALALCRSDHERRGEKNIKKFSNELDMEHNVLDDHNDSSSGEGCVQNVENADHGHNVNFKMDFTQDCIWSNTHEGLLSLILF